MSQSIFVRYIPATSTKPSRLKAFCEASSCIVSYSLASEEEPHFAEKWAIKSLLYKLSLSYFATCPEALASSSPSPWEGYWLLGGAPSSERVSVVAVGLPKGLGLVQESPQEEPRDCLTYLFPEEDKRRLALLFLRSDLLPRLEEATTLYHNLGGEEIERRVERIQQKIFQLVKANWKGAHIEYPGIFPVITLADGSTLSLD